MQFSGKYPWWSGNSYTLVWPINIPHGRAVDEVEVCVHITAFEQGENRFPYNGFYRGVQFHVLTPKQRRNIEKWISLYRDRARIEKKILSTQRALEALFNEKDRIEDILWP